MCYTAKMTWDIAPVGTSGLKCKCGRYLSLAEEDSVLKALPIECKGCQQIFKMYQSRLGVRHDCASLLNDEFARTATWYHSTENSDWIGSLSRSEELMSLGQQQQDRACADKSTAPMVHIGTRTAALHRIQALGHPAANRPWYLYTLEITEGTTINKVVLPDQDSVTPKIVGQCKDQYVVGLNRYVNKYESPGSVSALVDYRRLTVLAKSVMT